MYLFNQLKPHITITNDTVECPVLGCNNIVERQKATFRVDDKYLCKDHQIYISPSTHQLVNYNNNLLWKSSRDTNLLESICKVKRDKDRRLGRERSEDALTWNVFRYLDNMNDLLSLCGSIRGKRVSELDVIYWSYSTNLGKQYPLLNEARLEFGETIGGGSEPDLILDTKEALYFIEVKFGSSNYTTPTIKKDETIEKYYKKYRTGGDCLFNDIFTSSFDEIFIAGYYELLRFWLLGNWMAKKENKEFYLINLTPMFMEEDIETRFGKYIKATPTRKFLRLEWEANFYSSFANKYRTDDEKLLMNYFLQKTLGYTQEGNLVKAFYNQGINPKKIKLTPLTKEENKLVIEGLKKLREMSAKNKLE